MLERVNIFSGDAVYTQIENGVQFAIASGEIKEEDQLPSVRELAERLDVNTNTVAKAYRDLEVMGYLYTRRGMGVYISPGATEKCRERCRKRLIGRLFQAVAEAKAAGMSASQIDAIVNKSIKADSQPYGNAPDEVMALAKGKSGR